jgi:hypothetical protein
LEGSEEREENGRAVSNFERPAGRWRLTSSRSRWGPHISWCTILVGPCCLMGLKRPPQFQPFSVAEYISASFVTFVYSSKGNLMGRSCVTESTIIELDLLMTIQIGNTSLSTRDPARAN